MGALFGERAASKGKEIYSGTNPFSTIAPGV
jgi:hypothetical protein